MEFTIFIAIAAFVIYKLIANFRARRFRVASATALVGARTDIQSLGPSVGKRLLGKRMGKKILYVLCRTERWGAVYLIDQVVKIKDADNTRTELVCVLALNDVEIPAFVLLRKTLTDRLGPLSYRLTGPRPISIDCTGVGDEAPSRPSRCRPSRCRPSRRPRLDHRPRRQRPPLSRHSPLSWRGCSGHAGDRTSRSDHR